MIMVKENNVKIEGKENDICRELGLIFNNLVERIGETKTKRMINITLDVVIEKSKKDKKDLKSRIKRELPKNISDILCSLL